MKVLIAGAGIAGLTLAPSLRREGHEPLVVEAAPRLGWQRGRVALVGDATAGHRASWPLAASILKPRIAAQSVSAIRAA